MKNDLLDEFATVAKDMGYKVKDEGSYKTNDQKMQKTTIEFSYGIEIKTKDIVKAAFSKDSLDMKKILMDELEYDSAYFIQDLAEHLGVDENSLSGAYDITPKEWEDIINVKGDGTPSRFKINHTYNNRAILWCTVDIDDEKFRSLILANDKANDIDR